MRLLRLLVLGCLVSGPFFASARAADPVVETTKKAPAEITKEAKKVSDESTKEVKKAKKKRDWYPFHGKVASVNTTAKTVTLEKIDGERVLRLDGSSKLTSRSKVATLGDLKVGDYAHGKLHKNTRDEEVVTDAKFDLEAPKKAIKKAEKAEKKAEKKAATAEPAK